MMEQKDRDIIRTWKKYIDNGNFGNSRDIVDMYNKVFEGEKQKQPYTTCGSCLRRCVRMMYDKLIQVEAEEVIIEIEPVTEPPVEETKTKKTKKVKES